MHEFLENIKKNYEYEIDKKILKDQEQFFNFICSGFLKKEDLIGDEFGNVNGIGGKILPSLMINQKETKYKTKLERLLRKIKNQKSLIKLLDSLHQKFEGMYFQLLKEYNDELNQEGMFAILKDFMIIEKPSWKKFRTFVYTYIDQQWQKLNTDQEEQKIYDQYLEIIDQAFDDLTPEKEIDPLAINSKEIKGNEFSAWHLISDYQKFMKFVKENYTEDNWKFFDQIENKNLDHDLRKFNCFIVLANSINFCGMSNYRGGQNVMLVKDGDVTKLNEVFYLSRERKNLNNFLKEVGLSHFLKFSGTPSILACKK